MKSSKIKSKFKRYRIAIGVSLLYIGFMLIVGSIMSRDVRELINQREILGKGYITARYMTIVLFSSLMIFSITCIVLKIINKDRSIINKNLNELEEKEKAIKEASSGLENQRKLIHNVLESASVFVLILDEDFNIERSTRNIKDITEFEERDINGKNLSSIIEPRYIERIKKELKDNSSYGLELAFDSKYGRELYCYGTIKRERNKYEENPYYSFVLFDISQKKDLQDQIRYLDSYDSLTDLPNRSLAERMFTSKLPDINRSGNPAALLFIDIDHFAIINETKGHHAGDRLLMDVANRLKKIMKDEDILARITQDKFIAILTGENSIDDIECRIRSVIESTSMDWKFEEKNYIISTTLGVSLYPKDGLDFISLLKSANLALECAKENSRKGFEYYNADRKCSAVKNLSIVSDIKIALKEGQFRMLYQPIYNLETEEIENVESLIRWYHPNMGYIPPDEFIPAAESYWIIDEIGEYTLEEVFRQKVEWNLLGYQLPRVSINISAITFSKTGFAQYIGEKLEDYGLRGEEIVLELTESGFTSNETKIQNNVKALRSMGVQISMDDFGTGYSSLARLKDLQIDEIKLDRSFVFSLLEDGGQEIIKTLISLAKALGKDVVSEGIETSEQYHILKKLGSNYGQGYFLAKPMPAEDLVKLLKRQMIKVD